MIGERLPGPKISVLLAAALLSLFLSYTQKTAADPGILPSPGETLAFLDFSPYPNGSPLRQNILSWRVRDWTAGVGSLQLLHSGAFLEVVFQAPAIDSSVRLMITHRSASAPGCPSGGFAPVTITINDTVLAQSFTPPPSSQAFTTNAWEIKTLGTNRVRITTGELCSAYEIRRVEIVGASRSSLLVEDSQMTRGIRSNRPVDSTLTFFPNDKRAMLWVKVAPGVEGRRIEWRFYQPSGELYFETRRYADRNNWGWISIRGWRAARLTGRWRVDFFIEGQRHLSVPFTIGRGSPSRVTFIDFPDTIEADGSRYYGKVHFRDPDGDITFVKFEVVQAVHFNPFSFDPDVEGQTSGTFRFYIYANTRQIVTLKVTLFDRQGHASEPYLFTFRAI